jgi:fatty-acid desaturase
MLNISFIDRTSIKIVVLTIVAILSVPYYFMEEGTLLGFIIVRLVGHILGFSNPFGYHRWLSHNQFKPNTFGKIAMSLGMVSSGFGSPLHNVIAHRLHHPHYDTNKDPHNPKRLKFLKMWLGRFEIKEGGLRPPKDFFRNKTAVFLHNHYWKLWWSINVVVFLLFDLKTALIFLPINFAYAWTMNVALNYFGHYNSKEDKSMLKNMNKIFTILTAGEGLHKNHHDNPQRLDFSSEDRKDPALWLIKLMQQR